MAAKTAKAPNYSAEQTEALKNAYLAGQTVDEIAEAMGRARKSVIAKLVREDVYQTPEKAVKVAKDEGPTKKDMIRELAELVPDFPVDGLMNATKEAIQAVINRLRPAAE